MIIFLIIYQNFKCKFFPVKFIFKILEIENFLLNLSLYLIIMLIQKFIMLQMIMFIIMALVIFLKFINDHLDLKFIEIFLNSLLFIYLFIQEFIILLKCLMNLLIIFLDNFVLIPFWSKN